MIAEFSEKNLKEIPRGAVSRPLNRIHFVSVPAAHLVDREAINAVGLIVSRDLKWLFREQPASDYGIDAHLEPVVHDRATGRLVGLQIKGGESYLREERDDCFLFRGDPKHLRYWLAHSLPVLIVLYDPATGVAYWEHVVPERVTEREKGWTIKIPKDQILSNEAEPRIRAISDGDPVAVLMRRLQLESPWMDLLRRGNCLFVQVEEWINKTSGRGNFTLLVQDPGGEEQVERVWPFQLFPGIPYEDVLRGLFDWADVSIDEEFYEAYDQAQFEEETGMWDSETGEWIVFESFEEWRSKQAPGLRPYETNGEVASWRVELKLNEVGHSFLTLDKYLSTAAKQDSDAGGTK